MGYSSRRSRAARIRYGHAFNVFICCASALFWCVRTFAQPVDLSWQAPKGCPEAASVEEHVQGLLAHGSARFDRLPSDEPNHGTSPLRARVDIGRSAGRYRLRLWLTITGHHAARTLYAKSCAELADTAAWLIALAINPNISAASREDGRLSTTEPAAVATTTAPTARALAAEPQKSKPERAEADTPPARASNASVQDSGPKDGRQVQTPEPTLTARPRTAGPPLLLIAHAGAAAGIFSGGGVGVQPAVSAFAGLGAGWSYTQARFSGLLPRSVDVAPGASARLWSLELELSQCAMWGETLRLGPCLALAGLRTSARVKGAALDAERAALWAVASAGVQLFWRLRKHLALSLSANAGLPISPRPRFTVEGLGPVLSAQAWSADARIGLAFASP